MKRVILYVASSLDGFIAREDGSVDWLEKYEKSGEDYGYKDFLNSIDTVILGNTTFKQFQAPYPNKNCFVFSRKNTGKKDNITYVNSDVVKFIDELSDIQNIWLVGGAEIIQEFLRNNLVDEIIITVIPIILGKGISLFSKEGNPYQLYLQNVKSYDSVVQLHYRIVI